MSEKVLMRDCGDGRRRSDAGSFSPYANKTAAYTVTVRDAGKLFSNRGASGSITLTLPSIASSVSAAVRARAGLFFRLFKVTAQNVVFTATGGATINGGGANGSVTIATNPGLFTIVCDGTAWILTQEPSSATLAGLEQGTDGQLIVGQTASAPLYKSITGDVTFTAAGASAIGAAKVLSAMMDDNLVRYTEVAISSADIVSASSGKLSHANGQILLAAPASGEVLELISAVLIYDYAGAGYGGGGNLTINWAAGVAITGLISAANSLGAAADNVTVFRPLTVTGNAMTVATGINLVSSAVPWTLGSATGVARVKVTYRQHTTGLA